MTTPIASLAAPGRFDAATLDPARTRAHAVYQLIAERYDDAALGFWRLAGEGTIDRLGLVPGMSVLDVACGSGAATIPAAAAVGPTGRVIGLDLSPAMLERAAEKARRAGLDTIEFRQGDMSRAGFPDASFDAVVCVFGVFWIPDMHGLVADLWRMVKPGGRLAVTTWGPRLWAPMYDVWRDAVRAERPDLVGDEDPWDRVTDPTSLATVLTEGGVPEEALRVVPSFDRWPLRAPRDWWSIVMGSGLRWAMEQLDQEAAARVRTRNLDYAKTHAIEWVTCNILYASAIKPAG